MRKKDQSIHKRLITNEGDHGSLDSIEFMDTTSFATADSPEYSSEEKNTNSAKSRQMHNRFNHNELEKSRRAQLKSCLDKLREVVPKKKNGYKKTTLALLTKSKTYIRTLEDKEKKQLALKEELLKEQRCLKRRIEELQQLAKDGELGSGNAVLLPTDANSIQVVPAPAKVIVSNEIKDRVLHETELPASPSNSSSNSKNNGSTNNPNSNITTSTNNNRPHILKRKGYEIVPDSDVTEIKVEDAEGYCLMLDDIDMLHELKLNARICGSSGAKLSRTLDPQSLGKIRAIATTDGDEHYIEVCEIII